MKQLLALAVCAAVATPSGPVTPRFEPEDLVEAARIMGGLGIRAQDLAEGFVELGRVLRQREHAALGLTPEGSP